MIFRKINQSLALIAIPLVSLLVFWAIIDTQFFEEVAYTTDKLSEDEVDAFEEISEINLYQGNNLNALNTSINTSINNSKNILFRGL